jgi:hypothetical protein
MNQQIQPNEMNNWQREHIQLTNVEQEQSGIRDDNRTRTNGVSRVVALLGENPEE